MTLIAELAAEIEKEEARIAALIDDAANHHGTMPDNHWKRLVSLREQLRLRRAIEDAVREAIAD